MSAGTSAFLCLMVCLLLCSSEAVKIIKAELGKDVTLPCKAPENFNITAVEWVVPGLNEEAILVYRDGKFTSEHPSYKNRVDLKDRTMKDGDVSLVLKNVTTGDKGSLFDCRVIEVITKEEVRYGERSTVNQVFQLEIGDKNGGAKVGGDKAGIILGVVGLMLLLVF